MNVKVILTGIAFDLNGKKEQLNTSSSTVGELRKDLLDQIPELTRYSFNISVNGLLADDSLVLSEDDEILVFTPFSGG